MAKKSAPERREALADAKGKCSDAAQATSLARARMSVKVSADDVDAEFLEEKSREMQEDVSNLVKIVTGDVVDAPPGELYELLRDAGKKLLGFVSNHVATEPVDDDGGTDPVAE